MFEIGPSLREARLSRGVEIPDAERATKIRAKYLRALENEEWDLLPGPTYVKTFLRTYAETLGLDAKLLVEEYKLRHERLSDSELRPIRPPSRVAKSRPNAPNTVLPRRVRSCPASIVSASMPRLATLPIATSASGTRTSPPALVAARCWIAASIAKAA